MQLYIIANLHFFIFWEFSSRVKNRYFSILYFNEVHFILSVMDSCFIGVKTQRLGAGKDCSFSRFCHFPVKALAFHDLKMHFMPRVKFLFHPLLFFLCRSRRAQRTRCRIGVHLKRGKGKNAEKDYTGR